MKYFIYIISMLLSSSLLGQDNIAFVGSDIELISYSNDKIEDGVFETNFELLDRIILVEAELNGEVGKYILDTGSPILMLNKKPKNPQSKVGGIVQNCNAELVKIKKFKWAGMSKESIQAMTFDMTNLEEMVGTKISGLIGQNVFGNYEMYIDIPHKKIKLFNTRKSKLHKEQDYKGKISFSMEKHVPVITVKIDGKKYKFGIDSGAEMNVLDKSLKNKFAEKSLHHFIKDQLHGIDGTPQTVESATLTEFKIKGSKHSNHNFLLVDLSSLEKEFDIELDGILGFPFLLENVLSINYKKKKIYFW